MEKYSKRPTVFALAHDGRRHGGGSAPPGLLELLVKVGLAMVRLVVVLVVIFAVFLFPFPAGIFLAASTANQLLQHIHLKIRCMEKCI